MLRLFSFLHIAVKYCAKHSLTLRCIHVTINLLVRGLAIQLIVEVG